MLEFCQNNRYVETFEQLTFSVLDLGFDQGGGIPHQAEKGGGIWQLSGGVIAFKSIFFM